MFSDHEVATEVLDMMVKFRGELNNSLVTLKGRVPEKEWEAYRRGVGAIMGEILLAVTYQIGEQYPDLHRKLYGE